MTKSASSKKRPKPSSPEVDPIKAESRKCNKMGCEIDKIFACKKREKPEKDTKANTGKSSSQVSTSSSQNLSSTDMVKNVKKKKPVKDTLSSDDRLNSRPRKKTADGLRIFTEEELGFGNPNAGGTGLCPFDCDCCF